MISIETEISLEIAHRLMNHAGKCCNLHGHSYKLLVEVSGVPDDDTGMIMDFGTLKELLGEVAELFDHRTVLHRDDPLAAKFTAERGQHLRLMEFHPTAENLVEYIADYLDNALEGNSIETVRLYETAKCCAIWRA